MKPLYTLGMLLLLVVLGAYVFLFEREPIDPNAPTPGEQFNVLSGEFADVSALEISQNAPAKTVSLKRVEGQWQFAKGQPADRDRIESVLRQLTPWQASARLEESFDMKQAKTFGLETPALIVKVTFKDKSESLKVGNKTPTNSGYYVMHEGDPALYLSFVNVPEDLQKLVQQPPIPPEPEPASSTAPAEAK